MILTPLVNSSNRLYNFLVVYREPRTVYTTVMYGLPVLTLFVIGCVGILLSDLYSFCHYLFCRRCIRCCMRRRKKSTDEKYKFKYINILYILYGYIYI